MSLLSIERSTRRARFAARAVPRQSLGVRSLRGGGRGARTSAAVLTPDPAD